MQEDRTKNMKRSGMEYDEDEEEGKIMEGREQRK